MHVFTSVVFGCLAAFVIVLQLLRGDNITIQEAGLILFTVGPLSSAAFFLLLDAHVRMAEEEALREEQYMLRRYGLTFFQRMRGDERTLLSEHEAWLQQHERQLRQVNGTAWALLLVAGMLLLLIVPDTGMGGLLRTLALGLIDALILVIEVLLG